MKERARRVLGSVVLRRLGGGLFVFFLAKGLLWLALPAAVALWAYAT